MTLHLAQDEAADALLAVDPLALLIGMQLDQQFPMERAFGSPYLLAQRLGVQRLDAAQLADADPDELVRVFTGPPALHRFPGSMAARVQAMSRLIVENFTGDAATVWTGASSGAQLLARLESLPGFGSQKARIFVALLGKQFGVRPDGWREAAGGYGEDGTHRSVADVTGPDSLATVREFKRAAKQAAKGT
ncbi:MAG: Fe-S cluster assembly protein HesB [Pseudonocardiales bacterium]|nr:MAG: Fe-S cluster assembly protein HesB [Pseudonocardiales bacterium]